MVDEIAGVILAGGLSRRMGGSDKSLRMLGGKPLIQHMIERLGEQARPLALNANGDPARLSAFALPIIADETGDFLGPLAGILAGLRWAAKISPEIRFIVTATCDTPFIPSDLVERLLAARRGEHSCISIAASGGRVHPVIGLWPVMLAEDLASFLAAGARKALAFTERHPRCIAEFPFVKMGTEIVDPFFNTNTFEELSEAERLFYASRCQNSH